MLDINFIRKNPDIVKKDLKKRHDEEKIDWLDDLLKKDEEWRKAKQEADELRARRNKASLEINESKKQGKDISKLIKEIKEIPDKIKKLEEKETELKEKIHYYLMRLPNILHDSVPYGKDASENAVIRTVGKPKKFDFEVKPHGELMEELNIADFKRAAKIAGTGFYYLKGALALLDISLQRFAIDFLIKRGFTLIEPPFMMNRESYEGVIELEAFEKVMYKIQDEDLYMIATSEHPMGAMHAGEIIDEKDLPIRFCGMSTNFRREIGSHGVDTRGLFRVHQFNKIEQFVFCKPEDSWKMHEEIQKNSEDMYKGLEIPFRVVSVCTGDIGVIAAKKYDIEAWSPREKQYFEVGSNSNCTAYQAARLNIKLQRKDCTREYLHTLNNTGIATSRAMRAILENYQNKDGTITVPKVLVPYMNGIKKIDKI
ncbi:MAG: serine--tRNA ligase [Candidatus Woesearchaeota archaeon]|nr:serine--tRNA ligase [Candidatus Woesearchaeota archaeon]